MAKKSKRTKEDYPIVKYRVVDGNGYSLCEGENELKEKLKRDFEYYESVKGGYDTERFKPQYVIKVTEEYIEIPYQCAEEKLTEFEKGVHQMVDTAVREGGLTPLQYEICCKNLLERAQRELEHPSWKPSEEQMNGFHTVLYQPQYISNSDDERLKQAESLYNDLKKL